MIEPFAPALRVDETSIVCFAQRPPRKFSEAFRAQAVGRLRESDNVVALCRELGISRQLLYQWRDRLDAEQGKLDPAVVTERQLRHEIVKLKLALAEKTVQVDFLQGALEKIEALRRGSSGSGGTASTSKSGK